MGIEETELYDDEFGRLTEKVLVYFAALVAPFILIPIERLLPYPYVLEELVKLVIVYSLYKLWSENEAWEVDVKSVMLVALAGLAFAASESVLFLMNSFMLGNFTAMGMRLLFTVPMHVFTTVVIYVIGHKGKWCWVLGLVLAAAMHYLFNVVVR